MSLTIERVIPTLGRKLDQVLAQEVKTKHWLVAGRDLALSLNSADEVVIKNIELSGLGNYNENADQAYSTGNVTIKSNTYKLRYSRSKILRLDARKIDTEAGIDVLTIAKIFIQEKVAPELDAFRFAAVYAKAGKKVTGTLTVQNAYEEIRKGLIYLQNQNVNLNNVTLVLSHEIKSYLEDTKRITYLPTGGTFNPTLRNFNDLKGIVGVSDKLFKTTVTISATDGFTIPATAKSINFILTYDPAVKAIQIHNKLRFTKPDANQLADATDIRYRVIHDLLVLENKKNTVYVHTK